MAGYTLTTQLVGAKELQATLADSSEFAKNELAKALNKAANDVQNEAVQLAPKQTGKLKSSIHTEYATPMSLTAKVGTNVVYARAQEYGTVGMTINVSQGRRTRSGGRTRPYAYIGNIQPKYYMKQAMENARANFTNYLEVAAKRIVADLAGK